MQWVIKLFLILTLSGCALFEKDTAEEKFEDIPPPPYQRLYDADYERVWRAVQIVLTNYPIAVNNLDAGILETDTIRVHKGWLRPEHPPIPPGGRFYTINVQVARGSSPSVGRPVVRVRVTKKVYIQRDFFSSKSEIPSDGLEEQVILYRIGREVQIDRGLEKVYKRMKKQ